MEVMVTMKMTTEMHEELKELSYKTGYSQAQILRMGFRKIKKELESEEND